MEGSENPFDNDDNYDLQDFNYDIPDNKPSRRERQPDAHSSLFKTSVKGFEPKIKQAPVDDEILSILQGMDEEPPTVNEGTPSLEEAPKEFIEDVSQARTPTMTPVAPTTPTIKKIPQQHKHVPPSPAPKAIQPTPQPPTPIINRAQIKPKIDNTTLFWLLQVIPDDDGNLLLLGKAPNANQPGEYVNTTIKVTKPRFVVHFVPKDPESLKVQEKKVKFKATCYDTLCGLVGKLASPTINTKFVTKENCFGEQQGTIDVLEASFIPSVNNRQRGEFELRNMYKNMRTIAQRLADGTHRNSDIIADIRGVSDPLDTQFLLKHDICGPTWISVTFAEAPSVNNSSSSISDFSLNISEESFEFTKVTDPTFNTCPKLNFTFIEPYYENGRILKIALQHYSNTLKNFSNASFSHLFDISASKETESVADLKLAISVVKMIDDLQTDVIVGYEINKTIEYLVLKAPKCYKLSRVPGIFNQRSKINRTAGRVTIDVLNALNEFESNEDLNVSSILLSSLGVEYVNSPENLNLLPELIAKLLAKKDYFQLYYSLSEITTKPFPEVTMYGRETRIVSLLTNKLFNQNHLLPNNRIEQTKKSAGNEKAQYAGGLVLDPIPGLSDNIVLVLDYNSLYPSIIREFNLCFTTRNSLGDIEDLDEEALKLFSTEKLPIEEIHTAIIPAIVTNLIMERKKYRQKGPENETQEEKAVKNVKQLAFKICVNSLYGTLGSDHNRFTAKHIAALITAIGRLCLKHAKDSAELLGYKVLYGDTDSIMVDTGSDNRSVAENVTKQICSAVNERFNYLELDNDDTFDRALFLQKKSYAFRNKDGIKCKGIAAVRRDHSGALKPLTYSVLNTLFSVPDHKFEKCIDLITREMARLRASKDLKDFIIRKDLSSSTANAVNAEKRESTQDHVLAALKLKKAFNQTFVDGDRIEYVVMEGEGRRQERCIPLKLVDESFVPDMSFYQQDLFNAIKALLVRIDGYDEYILKTAFGIKDTSIMKISEIDEEMLFDPYKKFDRFELACSNCSTVHTWPEKNPKDGRFFPRFSLTCSCNAPSHKVMSQLSGQLFDRLQRMSLRLHTGGDPDAILQEIEFLGKLFDENKTVFIDKETDPLFNLEVLYCNQMVKSFSNGFSYATVDLGSVFGILSIE